MRNLVQFSAFEVLDDNSAM